MPKPVKDLFWGLSQPTAKAACTNVSAARMSCRCSPTGVSSPSCSTFRILNSRGSIPNSRAIMSMWDSTANITTMCRLYTHFVHIHYATILPMPPGRDLLSLLLALVQEAVPSRHGQGLSFIKTTAWL